MYQTNIDELPRAGAVSGDFNPQQTPDGNFILGSIVYREGGTITSRIMRLDDSHPGVPYLHINDKYKTETIMTDGTVAIVKKVGNLKKGSFDHKPVNQLVNCLEDYKKEKENKENINYSI